MESLLLNQSNNIFPIEGSPEYEELKEIFENCIASESPIPNFIRIGNVHCHKDSLFLKEFCNAIKNYVNMKTVKVINLSNNSLPKYETKGAAGMDIRADFSRVTTENSLKFYAGSGYFDFEKKMLRIDPMARVLIPTGLKVGLPEGMEMQIRPRSGMALKKGLTVINTPGTVDEDYRGEVGVPVINLNTEPIWIEHAERICQAVFKEYEKIEWNVVDTLDETERGEGGFNSTGSK